MKQKASFDLLLFTPMSSDRKELYLGDETCNY